MRTPTLRAALLLLALNFTFPAARAELKGRDWPQWRGPDRDGVWRETNVVAKFDAPDIPVKWRAKVANGYSGPTVASGRVYVMDRVTEPKEQERVLCFDAENGKPLWSVAYDADYAGIGYPNGPRASVTVSDGRAYALGGKRWFHCLDAKTGEILWKKDLAEEYKVAVPDWGLAASPLVEGELVILHVGGRPDACVIALDRKSGKEVWRALEDRPSYAPPAIIEHDGRRVLVVWTGDNVAGLDPKSGKAVWKFPHPAKETVVAIQTPLWDGKKSGGTLFVSNAYDGALMLDLKPSGPEKRWLKLSPGAFSTSGLNTVMVTPVQIGGHVYGVTYRGELRCLDAATGERVWDEKGVVPLANWATAHLVKRPDSEKDGTVWLFNEKGQLIIARLTPKGYVEVSRAKLIEPTMGQLNQRGGVAWAHPAFAYGHVFARNDNELVCADLRAKTE